ncbi:SDR family NAD(P)-dependent oxidoreductase [Patescibacteria group bacterium]
MKLEKKVALVTGASRGIGAAVAIDLAAHGAVVVVNYLNSEEKAKAVAHEINKNGGEAIVMQADVGNCYDRHQLIKRIMKHFGQIDILVNNAAIFIRQAVWELQEKTVLKQLNCNYVGPLFLSRLAAIKMRSTGGGVIINIASNAGLRPNNHLGIAYSASKAALIHSSMDLARLLGRYNIRVNVVAPGRTDTDMGGFGDNGKKRAAVIKKIPLGRINAPEDVAKVVSFLASADAANMTGVVMPVDGGMNLV